jgi:glycosyltransferase involved in cell wall biosynthesis
MHLLVIAPEPMSPHLAGPAIRSLEMARQLARDFETTLAVPHGTDLLCDEPFRVRQWSRREILSWLADYDVVISQGTQYPARGCLRANGRRPIQVFDLHNPLLFELLGGAGETPARHQVGHLRRLTTLLLQRGDYFLCASPRQRDLWAGACYVTGRVASGGMQGTSRLDEYIGIVPFGHNGTSPRASKRVLKGVYPGIAATDQVILWGGGVWNWFDPLTLIRAMAEIGKERDGVKLFFMGTRRPDDGAAPNQMVEQARELAHALGLLGQTVFFNASWVPFAERQHYLLEADLAVCAAPQGVENAFSFRTRLVDAIWAGVPIVCTQEGFIADYVRDNGLGCTVRGGDVADVTRQVLLALQAPMQAQFRRNLAACHADWSWDRCVQPLRAFCTRVARGQYQRPPEPRWQPWVQYVQYKVPTLLEMSLAYRTTWYDR